MTFGDVLVRDECSFTLARIAPDRDGWSWECWECRPCSNVSDSVVNSGGHLSASAALADFEAHVERRHP